jgi:phospholipase/carboxylesterase
MEICEFPLPLTCRYLLAMPDRISANPAIVLALHGYGSNPETMLRLTVPTVEPDVIVAALQGPNQFYAGGPANGVAGYNWGIRDHHADAARMHHAMVLRTLEELQARFQVGPKRCFLMAFSQAAGFNFRFLGTHPDAVAGVIAICGGVPKDWEEPKYQNFSTPILMIARSEDEFFPEAMSTGFPGRLRKHASDVEFHMIPGQHRYPSKARDLVRPWMARVLGM